MNVVYRGSIVGSPAWAPRSTGALKLPTNQAELDKARIGYLVKDGTQGRNRRRRLVALCRERHRVLRRRAAARHLRQGPRFDLRKAQRGSRHDVGRSLHHRPQPERHAFLGHEDPAGHLRDAARRLAAGAGRRSVRGVVEQEGLPVDEARQRRDALDVGNAPAGQGRRLVLPRPGHLPGAPRGRPADDMVEPDRHAGLESALPRHPLRPRPSRQPRLPAPAKATR